MSELSYAITVDRHVSRRWRRYLVVLVVVELGKAAGGWRAFKKPVARAHTRWGARRIAARTRRRVQASR